MQLSFDVDVRVNVFEANIRLLGGLLSAHLLAADARLGSRLMPDGYDGGLLDLAYSLALRLLPAFLESPTGGLPNMLSPSVSRAPSTAILSLIF